MIDQYFRMCGEVVVGDDCWDCGEQVDGGSDQCFGDIWGDGGQGCLLYGGQVMEGVYDILDGIEQVDVWVGGIDGCQEWQVGFEFFFFMGDGYMYGVCYVFYYCIGIDVGLLVQMGKFFEVGMEDLFDVGVWVWIVIGLVVQFGQVDV